MKKKGQFTRRDMLKIAAAGGATKIVGATGAATLFGKAYGQTVCADTVPVDITTARDTGCPIDLDMFPTSPFIVNPFTDQLPIPSTLRPGYRNPDGTLSGGGPSDWTVREKNGRSGSYISAPGPGTGMQDSLGDRPMSNEGKTYTFFNPKTGAKTSKTLNFGGARKGTHQLYAGGYGSSYKNLSGLAKQTFDAMNPNPLYYHIRYQVAEHGFTSSDVRPIDSFGRQVTLPPGASAAPGSAPGLYKMPKSTMYTMNGTFPGPRINVTYGQPIIVRYENDLDMNPNCLNRGDFGAPDWAVLTHLHNGHTAPESDGQPHDMQDNDGGYRPGQWVDSSYLVYSAGGDDAEKQCYLWFHDHRMHHTGPNVYKGQVGLMPHYDIQSQWNPTGIDGGDETQGCRIPGVRTDNGDGTFDVMYDVPLAFYDFRTDDGLTPHEDTHQPMSAQAWSNNVCGNLHPEWWGKLFLQHYPNHGFVGDIFTTNGVAFPVMQVEPRRYRFRFLDASLSRQYELSLRKGNLVPAPGRQGQWSFGSVSNGNTVFDLGQQVMRMTQISTGGGLLPSPILRDFLQVWPAKRREVVIDFSKYQDGTPTSPGDVVYLTNTAFMPDGRQINGSLAQGSGAFAVPLVKFVIGGKVTVADKSDPTLSPVAGMFDPKKVLRPRHTPPGIGNSDPKQSNMDFTLQRGGSSGGETEWLINGLQFDPSSPMWAPTVNTFETWGINNGGGGWTHPMHVHMEEHQVIYRTGKEQLAGIVSGITEDPMGKFDLVMLQPSEQTKIYRGFRTFVGNYVAHCHNLAHEDHNMMFGWSITK
jgi:FtsP/CotA-like multicopper oxidase with cupredoxin domain